MLITRVPAPSDRPRLAHGRAVRDAIDAAWCAVRLALAGPEEEKSLLRAAEAQLRLARQALDRLR